MAAKSVKNHVSVEATATTAGSSSAINVKKIIWLTNDGAVDLLVNFDNTGLTAGTDGCFTVKPNEIIDKEDIKVGTIYYKSASATCAFRLLGIPDDDNSAY